MSMNDFEIVKKLGEGAFSSVWKVKRNSDEKEYAMKQVNILSLSQKEKENALNEVRILASINNPYIIGYKEAFIQEEPLSLCIVMELAGGGDLQKKILDCKNLKIHLPEELIWRYAVQLVHGIKALHDLQILHRDLKSANIFLTKDGTIKIGDLNVSKISKCNLAKTQTGTPYYASPEVWKGQSYDKKCDIWSLGCVIYELCALNPPFRSSTMAGLFTKITKGHYERIPFHYSNSLSKFISMCLQVLPSSRPCCQQLLEFPHIQKYSNLVKKPQESSIDRKDLLKTIILPNDFRDLIKHLPKPNYSNQPTRILSSRIPKTNQKEKFKLNDREIVIIVRKRNNSFDATNLSSRESSIQYKRPIRIREENPILKPRGSLDNQNIGIDSSQINISRSKNSTPKEEIKIEKKILPQIEKKNCIKHLNIVPLAPLKKLAYKYHMGYNIPIRNAEKENKKKYEVQHSALKRRPLIVKQNDQIHSLIDIETRKDNNSIIKEDDVKIDFLPK